jgi:23S rRNA (adenine2503-C2)-methyltransferase
MILKGLTLAELEEFFLSINQPKYRAKQLFNWIYNHNVDNYDGMDNLPKDLRKYLQENTILDTLSPIKELFDDVEYTKKIVYQTLDGKKIESVIIPDESRNKMTLCLSTQVGCPLDCKFCATGQMGYIRNLSAGEIVDQYFITQRNLQKQITNIVYMGMGEPLINFEATIKSLQIFTHDMAKKLSRHHITISTSGIPEKIKLLADLGIRVKLALSLHSCFNDIRTQIMPINKKYPIDTVIEALKFYYKVTNQRITYEYTMFEGINDRDEDIEALSKLAAKIPSKINIIPFNSISHMIKDENSISAKLKPTPMDRIEHFANQLRNRNVTVFIRNTQGNRIKAACGQLANAE